MRPTVCVPFCRERRTTICSSASSSIVDEHRQQSTIIGVDGRPGLDSAVICRAALEEHSAFDLIDAAPQEVAQLLRQLWGGPETLIVASSDLSHITATRLHRVWIYRLPKPSNKANGPVWARVEPVAG